MGRRKAPRNTSWRYTQRKINGIYRDVKVRRVNGKEQVRIIPGKVSNPLNEPLPDDAAIGSEHTKTHIVKGRKQKTTYKRMKADGFGKWKIVSSEFV